MVLGFLLVVTGSHVPQAVRFLFYFYTQPEQIRMPITWELPASLGLFLS